MKRALALGDVVLLLVITGTNLQWIATAAAAGPSALTAWLLGALFTFAPLAICVIELSARYPNEGGLYVWSKQAFGPFAGFITGWTYWCSNLSFFPSVLYFAAGSSLFMGGASMRALSASGTYYIVFSVLGLALATALNVRGLEFSKWLNNIGAVTQIFVTFILILLAALVLMRSGLATPITRAALLPGHSLADLTLLAAIAFAWTGSESASFMGDEIHEPRRTVPRALVLAAPIQAAVYILGTLSLLIVLPAAEITGLQGIVQGVERAAGRLGLPMVTPLTALILAIGALGSVSAWLGAAARIPFVAGLDHYLPAGFGRLHPRWGTPVGALVTQALLTVVFVVMGQAGTSVRGAYKVLVSMTMLATFLPFLFLFAATLKLAGQVDPHAAWRVPGGRPVVMAAAALGLFTTAVVTVLSALPAPDEPNQKLALFKVLGGTVVVLGIGAATYALGRQRAARASRY